MLDWRGPPWAAADESKVTITVAIAGGQVGAGSKHAIGRGFVVDPRPANRITSRWFGSRPLG